MYEIIYITVTPSDVKDIETFVGLLKEGFKIVNSCSDGRGIIAYVLERVIKNKKK